MMTTAAVMPPAACESLARARTLLLALLLLTLVCARWLIHNQSLFLTSDSVLFLYAGQQLSQGGGLYTEYWDHKPPLIFYLNALGLWLGGGSAAGVVLLQYGFLVVFLVLLWAILAPLTLWARLLGALYAVNLIPSFLSGSSNFTETYSMPLQALSMYLLLRESETGPRWRCAIGQGLLGAALFWLRPNNAGAVAVYLAFAAALALYHRRLPELATRAAWACVGFGAGTAVLALPFAQRGAMDELIHASLGFNLDYSGIAGLSSRLAQLYNVLTNTSYLGVNLMAFAAAGWTVLRFPGLGSPAARLAVAAVISGVVELLAASVSGRSFSHYLLMAVLPLSMLAAVFWSAIWPASGSARAEHLPALLAAGLAAVSAISSLWALSPRTNWSTPFDAVVKYVQERTSPADRIYVWGPDRGIYFRAGRKSASRFFSTVFMGHDRSIYQEYSEKILDDIEKNNPELIVEVVEPVSYPTLFAGDIAQQRGWNAPASRWDDERLLQRKSRLREAYEVAMVDPAGAAVVYRRTGQSK